jgi:hypothetical protein
MLDACWKWQSTLIQDQNRDPVSLEGLYGYLNLHLRKNIQNGHIVAYGVILTLRRNTN